MISTPWGDTEKLRGARLHPGTQPRDRTATEHHQRQRLYGGIVAAVVEKGYAGARLEDVTRISGIVPSEFYKLFDSKLDCFLSAVEILYREGMRRAEAAYGTEPEDWERRLRAAFAAVIEMIVSEPAAAHATFVDVYEAGPQGEAQAEAGAVGFERLLRRGFAQRKQRATLPPAIATGIVGGVQMLIHDRLRAGAERELPEAMDDLAQWALAYEAPSQPLPEPHPHVEPLQHSTPADPGERLLVALAELSTEKGYRAVSVNELARRAQTSLRTLYGRFGGKEEAFRACLEMVGERALRAAREAYDNQMPDWPLAMHAANAAVLRYLASEPAFARLAFVDVLAAGREALELRDGLIKEFGALLDPGFDLAPDLPRGPVGEAIAFGVYSLARRELGSGEAARLPRLAPLATFFDLTPFIGPEQAAQVAGEEPRLSG